MLHGGVDHQVDLVPVVVRQGERSNVDPGDADANGVHHRLQGVERLVDGFRRPPAEFGVSAADRRRRLDNTCGFNKIEGQRFSAVLTPVVR